MVIRTRGVWGDEVRSSEITPEAKFRAGRRSFLAGAAAMAAAGALPAWGDDVLTTVEGKLSGVDLLPTDKETPFQKATTYNNFYEYGIDKDLPAKNAKSLRTRPWEIQVTGLVKKPLKVGIDDLMHYRPLESRVYRHRCVEAWSMVIPWDGYSLSEFVNFCQPLPSAKYLQFISKLDLQEMNELPQGFDWPYKEGLRMDEAMNPLTLLTFGCYGKVLPNQNGAPVRVVVPWKWGYKSAKSIVKVVFTDHQPATLWNEMSPQEYGFYSNVNPALGVRWSQEHERRIDGGFPHTVPTQMFNGYGDLVAGMYAGMDLKKYY